VKEGGLRSHKGGRSIKGVARPLRSHHGMGGGRHGAGQRRWLALLDREEEGCWLGQKFAWADWLLGRNMKENSFRNKNWIFEYTKALKICIRRFRRNFDVEIFPKFF
jgi:hypothetical protein